VAAVLSIVGIHTHRSSDYWSGSILQPVTLVGCFSWSGIHWSGIDGSAVRHHRSHQTIERTFRKRSHLSFSSTDLDRSFFLVFAHPIMLFLLDARYLRFLNIFTVPWYAKLGGISDFSSIIGCGHSKISQKAENPLRILEILARHPNHAGSWGGAPSYLFGR
jgi:hypothetical protein